MGRLLGLVVSARRLGNSELLVKEIMRRVPGEWERELIRVTDLSIKPCRACYTCLTDTCRLDDDFGFVMDKVKEADALVVGVPVYSLGPHGCFKMMGDRLLGAGRWAQHTRDKPCAVVVPYGMEAGQGYARTAALVFPRTLQMKLVDLWVPRAALPGEGVLSPENLARAAEIARRLAAGEERTKGAGECPVCGSDIFRLLPGGKVECPLCGVGSRLLPDGRLAADAAGGGRFSPEWIEEHFLGWLVEMKEKYRAEREKLREVQKPYRNMDWWVTPPERS